MMSSDVPCLIQHSIATGDSRPIWQPCRQIPSAKREQAQKWVQEMLQRDVIQPSNSPWASPVMLFQKKDGSCHFCVDYCMLDVITHHNVYLLPRIDESLGHSGFLHWTYYQVIRRWKGVRRIVRRPHFLHTTGCLSLWACPLAYSMDLPPSRG